MAAKKPNPKEDPPSASSTDDEDEEEEETSTEEEEEEDEEEASRPKLSTPKPVSQQSPAKKPEASTSAIAKGTMAPGPEASSGSESSSEESETDSNDESGPNKAPVKPISSKPVEDKKTLTATSPKSKVLALAAKKLATANENTDKKMEPKDSKKPKRSGSDLEEEPKGEDTKKQLFQRLFSEDDEIALLKGLLEYSTKKGADPLSDFDGFFHFVKNSLQCDVTKAQLNDKIRRLKKKYMKNLSRGGKKGEEPSFSRPHEHKSYELSKKIWSVDGEMLVADASAIKKLRNQQQTPKVSVHGKAVPGALEGEKMEIDGDRAEWPGANDLLLMNRDAESVIKHGLELVDGKKGAELEERWRKLRFAQLELFVERTQLTLDLSKHVLEAAKSSNH